MRNLVILIICLLFFNFARADEVNPSGLLDGMIPVWVAGLIGLVYSMLEYVIGKTDWIKPNSVLDMIIQVLLKILKVFLPDKK